MVSLQNQLHHHRRRQRHREKSATNNDGASIGFQKRRRYADRANEKRTWRLRD